MSEVLKSFDEIARKRCPVFKPWQLQVMFRAVKETEETGNEKGFTIGQDLELNEFCEGSTCVIPLPMGKGERGFFHTHPSGDDLPSFGDVFQAVKHNQDLICVGYSPKHESWDPSGIKTLKEVLCRVSEKPPAKDSNYKSIQREMKGYSEWLEGPIGAPENKWVGLERQLHEEALEVAFPINCTYRSPPAKRPFEYGFLDYAMEEP